MATTPVNVIAIFAAVPDRVRDLERVLSAMVEPTRAESGCVNYDLHRHAEDSSRFLLYEGWKDQEALDEHMATPHFKSMLKELDELVAERDEQGRPFRGIALNMISDQS